MSLADRERCQVLVLGTGVAGVSAALAAAEAGAEVLLVSREPDPATTNTWRAQGGIVFRGETDSPALLAQDILTAGANYGYEVAAHFLASEGPKAVQTWLLDRLQVPFDRRPDGSLDLALEGAHSVPRVLHAEDHTGAAIEDALIAAARAHPRIRLETTYQAVDLLTTHHHSRRAKDRYALDNRCIGAYLLEVPTGRVCTVLAAATVLATGGAGALYIHTSNHPGSIGSGLAMASRAGARLLNLEFIQFHPTCLFLRGAPRFLITEALRGAGAHLVNAAGERFMLRHHPKGELAPRDVVARAIIDEMHRTDTECMFLDLGERGAEMAERFPTVATTCARYGIDITRERIPVVPASHYQCGGVVSDLRGRTTIPGLYAAGEVACTGVHGANRLASTSLLEGLTFGLAAGRDGAERALADPVSDNLAAVIGDWQPVSGPSNEDPALIAQDWSAIRHTMWNYVGIERTPERLERAVADLRHQLVRLEQFYKSTPISAALVNLFHGCTAAGLIAHAAQRNPLSVGCHYVVAGPST
ncbi:MAG TPA: L-aspartate oxidase [Thermoanaerobaculaceae bacterium]|nr:L-aspartate oxidase [Thermoanaerobaculaceae bacterium]HRS16475.1 L-aspartate oxidase [Thermoanaerobaculaceae bacterium]